MDEHLEYDMTGEMWIPCIPIAKGRPRMQRGTTKVYTPLKTRQFEDYVRRFVSSHHMVKNPIPFPMAVSIRFFFNSKKIAYHIKRPDLDNLAKAVLDALGPVTHTYLGTRTTTSGILFNDDCLVCRLVLDKFYHPHQGIWIQWKVLDEPFKVTHPMDRPL